MKKFVVYSEDNNGVKTAHTSTVSFENALLIARKWAAPLNHKVFYVENNKHAYVENSLLVIGSVDVEVAYGLYITLGDCGFDNLHKSNAKKKVDIAVKHNDTTKEFSLQEFVTLLGFGGV